MDTQTAITLDLSKETLIASATSRGYRMLEENNMIGFCKKYVWHWFKSYGTNEWFFDHSYSTNTGSSKRGLKHRWAVEDSLGLSESR